MSKKASYRTVGYDAVAEIEVKRSKFIAHVFPVDNESDALLHLQDVKKQYTDASHNVYAYIIDENNIFRYSDDGEPGGTAGMPVLDVMRKQNIVDCLIVVTRYFGGTLLGTGGLVRAYSDCGALGLENAKIITRNLCNIIEIACDYNLSGKILHYMHTNNIGVMDTIYEDLVKIIVPTLPENTDKFFKELDDLTNATAQHTILRNEYISF